MLNQITCQNKTKGKNAMTMSIDGKLAAMALSSISVVSNSLLLKRYDPQG
jgi:cation transport ATPase